MIAYHESERIVPTPERSARPQTRYGLSPGASHPTMTLPRDALIRFGTLEAALVDVLLPQE